MYEPFEIVQRNRPRAVQTCMYAIVSHVRCIVYCIIYLSPLPSSPHASSSLRLACLRTVPASRASWGPVTHLTSAPWRRRYEAFLTTTMSSISSTTAAAVSFEQSTPQDEATSLARLLETSTAILRQAVDFVENGLTSDDQLTAHSNYIPGSTIGTLLDALRLT